MNVRSKTIWLAAAFVIGYGVYQQTMGLIDIFCIFLIAQLLIRVFGDDEEAAATSPPPAVEKPQARFVIPEGKHLITTDAVKQFRNLLLRHHNMKQTDSDYTVSDMSKQTVAIVASLNVFLKGR